MSGPSTRLFSGLLHVERTELGTRAAAENVSRFVYGLAAGLAGLGSGPAIRGWRARVCVCGIGGVLLLYSTASSYSSM